MASIWSTNGSRALRVARQIKAGQVYINAYRAGGGIPGYADNSRRQRPGPDGAIPSVRSISTGPRRPARRCSQRGLHAAGRGRALHHRHHHSGGWRNDCRLRAANGRIACVRFQKGIVNLRIAQRDGPVKVRVVSLGVGNVRAPPLPCRKSERGQYSARLEDRWEEKPHLSKYYAIHVVTSSRCRCVCTVLSAIAGLGRSTGNPACPAIFHGLPAAERDGA